MDLKYERDTERPTQLGFIVLQADETLEQDMRRLLPPDVEMLVSRVPSGTELSQDSIAEMADQLTTAATLLPRGARCAAVGYACTSASAQIGSEAVAQLIKAGVATPHVTDPARALIAACGALGVTQVGLISPYVAAISDQLRAVLEGAGIATPTFASFNEPVEENVVRISARSVREAAITMGKEREVEAVFLSCTNLRTLDVIDAVEAEIGKPVLSSNQVLAWHMLQLAGVPCADGPGKLFRLWTH